MNEAIAVKFYDRVDDQLLKFAVIISKSGGKWVFCRHRKRNTYEVPGGDRLPDAWTYPQIQPLLIREFERKQDLDI